MWVAFAAVWRLVVAFVIGKRTQQERSCAARSGPARHRCAQAVLHERSMTRVSTGFAPCLRHGAPTATPRASRPLSHTTAHAAPRVVVCPSWPGMSIAVIAGNLAFSPFRDMPLTSVLSTQFFTLWFAISKCYLHVPQVVPLSMCHPICVMRGFGTGILGDSLPPASV